MKPPYKALTLAIHPNSRGFGWIAFSSPLAPYDWGNAGARGKEKNAQCLRRVEKLLDRLTPESLVLEAFERTASTRRNRIANLGRAITALAIARGVEVVIYTFNDVRHRFASLGARTRHDIAEATARCLEPLRHLLPSKRKTWESDRWRLSLFCAAALALTHYVGDINNLL